MSINPSAKRLHSVRDSKNIPYKSDEQRRLLIKYLAAILSTVTAVLYFLIGFHVVSVLEGNGNQTWGLFAGAAYLLGAVLLLVFDHRLLWILGAFLQVLVISLYFNLATQRVPAYEPWGILIRIIQLLLFIPLAYLALRPSRAQMSAASHNR